MTDAFLRICGSCGRTHKGEHTCSSDDCPAFEIRKISNEKGYREYAANMVRFSKADGCYPFVEDDVDGLEFGVPDVTCSVTWASEGKPILIKYSTGITEFRTYVADGLELAAVCVFFDANNNLILDGDWE